VPGVTRPGDVEKWPTLKGLHGGGIELTLKGSAHVAGLLRRAMADAIVYVASGDGIGWFKHPVNLKSQIDYCYLYFRR
jgi:hypothetical protein